MVCCVMGSGTRMGVGCRIDWLADPDVRQRRQDAGAYNQIQGSGVGEVRTHRHRVGARLPGRWEKGRQWRMRIQD